MSETRTIKIRLSTYRRLKVLAAEHGEKLMDSVERLVMQDRRAATYRERKLIAHVQALITAHRYPDMYDVRGVIADAEETWKQANQELLQIDKMTLSVAPNVADDAKPGSDPSQ